MHALTRAMACDHGPDNIRVNAICPGYVDTPMLQSFFDSMSEDGRLEDEARRVHPLRRYGTPRDMANLVNWLAGDEARYASGQLWVLDGPFGADPADADLEPPIAVIPVRSRLREFPPSRGSVDSGQFLLARWLTDHGGWRAGVAREGQRDQCVPRARRPSKS